jgi:hypothetical protein
MVHLLNLLRGGGGDGDGDGDGGGGEGGEAHVFRSTCDPSRHSFLFVRPSFLCKSVLEALPILRMLLQR